LDVEVPRSHGGSLAGLLQRVRRIFDLDADPEVISEALAADARLEHVVREYPGLRVPGAWSGFETSVRAILGQQVSVARATSLAAALCREFGGGDFPEPEALAEADVAAIGMPGQRGAAIRALARGVATRDLVLDESADFEELEARLLDIPGLGPWTVGYVSMRVARNPDAFPDKDWVVLKALGASPSAARQTADAWRPWRAYGVVTLWKLAERLRSSGEWRTRAPAGRRGPTVDE
jgi:AraC family transcriptional regulator of adaptative response / DNA-3-methyladenine glycosylase II